MSRASGARPGIQGDTTAHRFCRVTLGPDLRSRCALARPGHEGGVAAHAVCSLARSEPRAGVELTMSNSAVFFVPAARSCARVVALPCLVSPPHLRCRCRRCGGRARRHLGDSGRSGPLMRGGRSADRRTRLFCRSRVRGATTAPLRRGTVPLRAGPLSALHRGDFRPGTHAAVSGSGTPEPPVTCPRQAGRPGGRDPGPPGLRFAPQRRTPLPAPPAGSSPETPLRSEDANVYHNFDM